MIIMKITITTNTVLNTFLFFYSQLLPCWLHVVLVSMPPVSTIRTTESTMPLSFLGVSYPLSLAQSSSSSGPSCTQSSSASGTNTPTNTTSEDGHPKSNSKPGDTAATLIDRVPTTRRQTKALATVCPRSHFHHWQSQTL